MKKYRMPEGNRDLKRFAFWTNFKRIFTFIIYIAVWVLAYRFYLMYPINKPFVWWVMLIFVLLVLVSGWIISEMSRFVLEKSLVGKIESIKLSRTYGRGMMRDGKRSIDYHTFMILSISDESGKKRKVRFQLFDDGYNMYYKEGKTAVFFRGLNYPLCLEKSESDENICVVCGVRNCDIKRQDSVSEKRVCCASCGKSLINVEELK